jgi:hypothetical protein
MIHMVESQVYTVYDGDMIFYIIEVTLIGDVGEKSLKKTRI